MSVTDVSTDAEAAVERIRRSWGPVGAMLPVVFTGSVPIDAQRAAVRALERAGYGAAWTNEVLGGKDALVQAAVLLAATERMSFGAAVANIWARQPETMQAAAAQLAQAYPGRFALGIGVGYPEQAAAAGREFGRPLATMRDYRQRMDRPTQPPAPAAAFARILGAHGPRMLELAAEITDGAVQVMQPPEATARARAALGPRKVLVAGLRAAEDPGDVAARVREHTEAGADHVVLMVAPDGDFAAGVEQLERLAPAPR
ncbi:LLM class flavin-dependent oxidoreductase [Pseudonocardia zijingensis]|uniref:LLM class flavin-dependent oxidoreductase n=1 Tax=Pseudonocardia zijingensis TaxID=153376 RepID=A0ABN1N7W0_9PSEU